MFIVRQDLTEEELDREFEKVEEKWEVDRFTREEYKNKKAIIKSRQVLNDNDILFRDDRKVA